MTPLVIIGGPVLRGVIAYVAWTGVQRFINGNGRVG